jgi:uncharacterized membrane protein
MKRKLVVVSTFFAFSLVAQAAFADFTVCNKRSSGMWIAQANWEPSTTVIRRSCSTERVASGSSCNWSAWLVNGWYRAEAGKCVKTWNGRIPNRFVYIHATIDDGAQLTGPFAFDIQWAGFTWDEGETLHSSGQCVTGSGVFDPCSAQPFSAGFHETDVGSNSSFTLNIF